MPVEMQEVRESKRQKKKVRRAVYRFLRDNRGEAFTSDEIADALGVVNVDVPSPAFSPVAIKRGRVDGRRVYYARANRLYWVVFVIGAIGLGTVIPEQYVRLYSFFAGGFAIIHWWQSVQGVTPAEIVRDFKRAPDDLYLWLLRRRAARWVLVRYWRFRHGGWLVVVWPKTPVDMVVLNGRPDEYHKIGGLRDDAYDDGGDVTVVSRLAAEREHGVDPCPHCFADQEVIRPRL